MFKRGDFYMADSLEERIRKLDAKKKTLQAKLSRQKRAEDTRKKILLGSLLMAHMENERIDAWVKKELPKFLTRDIDKNLFSEFLSRQTKSSTESTDIWHETENAKSENMVDA